MKKRKLYLKTTILALSFLGMLGLPSIFPINGTLLTYSNNILPLLVWAGLYWLYKTTLDVWKKRYFWPSLILGLCFTIANLLGYRELQNLGFEHIAGFIPAVISVTPIFMACICLILHWIPEVAANLTKNKPNKNRLLFWIYWLLIFLAWIPVLCAFWPGIYSYDSIYQINFYTKKYFESIHPLLHTLLEGFFIVDLGNLLGSPERGMFLYSLFQSAILSGIFSAILSNLRTAGLKDIGVNILCLLFMFLPIFPIAAISATKDMIFSGLFALIILWTVKAGMNPELWKQKSFLLKFIATGIFFILFRTQAKVLVLLVCIFLLILYHGRFWKQILMSVAVIYGITGLFNTVMFAALDVNKVYNPQESLSVPCMQLARVMTEKRDQLSKAEKAEITDWIPAYTDYEILPGISDGVKMSFNVDRYKKDPADFYKFWLEIGMKYPKTYLRAWTRLTLGYWFPGMIYPDYEAYHPYWSIHSTPPKVPPGDFLYLDQKALPGFEWLNSLYTELSDLNTYQDYTFFSLFFSSGILIWVLLLYFSAAKLYKKYSLMPAILLMLIYWISLLFGPVVLFRYLFPIICSLPVIMGYLLSTFGKDNIPQKTIQ